MGYDLCGRKSEFRCNIWQWPACLDLALCFGWASAGPTAPGPRIWNRGKWRGGYVTNDWQYVEDQDAAGLAQGLEAAAIAFAAGQGATVEQNVALQQLLTADSKWPSSSRAIEILEKLSKRRREVLSRCTRNYNVDIKTVQGLARFCREGGFYIT